VSRKTAEGGLRRAQQLQVARFDIQPHAQNAESAA
jgi:hypothetical protein